MALTHREKLEAVREHLETGAVGWERRWRSDKLRRHLLKRHGLKISNETLQRITKELLRDGVLVCSDDTRGTGGYYVAASRPDARAYWNQLERRIRGTVNTQNVVLALMNEKFPQRDFAFSRKGG